MLAEQRSPLSFSPCHQHEHQEHLDPETGRAASRQGLVQQQQQQQYPPAMVPTDAAESSAQGSAAATAAAAASLSRANSRSQAIAKLKRAASQREMRSRAPNDTVGRDNERLSPPQDQGHWASSAPASNGRYQAPQDDDLGNDAEDEDEDGEELEDEPIDSRSRSTSPAVNRAGYGALPRNRLPQDFLRPAAASPTPSASHLVRSRSRQDRSPLPSLEQLRARILQERETAGLQRSASASEASKAARNYALNKLLGKSFRQGAVSPASEGEGDEDASDSGVGHGPPTAASTSRAEMVTPPPVKGYEPSSPSRRMSVIQKQKAMLRRSRTIGGLSAMAERQRKAAFVQGSTLEVPVDGAPRRSSRWFVHGAPARQMSDSQPGPSSDGIQDQPSQPPLSRQPSQREIARTEMMRKLSGRRMPAAQPAKDTPTPQSAQQQQQQQQQQQTAPQEAAQKDGAALSPRPPLKSLAPVQSESHGASTSTTAQGNGLLPIPSPGMQRAFLSPSPAGGPPSSAGWISPSYIPASPNEHQHRSSSASSYAHSAYSNLTSRYVQERDRASALARAEGEEAFLYDDMMARDLSRMGSTAGHDEDESSYLGARSPARSPAASTRPLSDEYSQPSKPDDEPEQATLRGSAEQLKDWQTADTWASTAVQEPGAVGEMEEAEPHEYLASADEMLRNQASPAVPVNDASPTDGPSAFDGPSRPWMLQDSGRVASSASIPLAFGSAPPGTMTFGDSEDEDRAHRAALATPMLGQGTPNSRSSDSERWPRSVASKETLGMAMRNSSEQSADDRRRATTPEGIPSSTLLMTPGRSPSGPSRGAPLTLDPNVGPSHAAPRQQQQHLLSPSFVNEFGNPLDYVRTPSSAGGSPQMSRAPQSNSPAQPSPSPSSRSRRRGTGLSTGNSEVGYWDLTDWDEAGTPVDGENDSSSEDGGEDSRERALPPLPTFTTTQHTSPRMAMAAPEPEVELQQGTGLQEAGEERSVAAAKDDSSAYDTAARASVSEAPSEVQTTTSTNPASASNPSSEGHTAPPRGMTSPTPSELGNAQIPQRSSSLSKRISLMNNAFRSARHAKKPSTASVLSNASTVNGADYALPQASSAELPALYANSKLTPFPGLFEQAGITQQQLPQPTPPSQSSPGSGPALTISRPAAKGIAPLAIFGDRSLGKAVNSADTPSASVTPSTEASHDGHSASSAAAAEVEAAASRPARVLSPKFFSSLRRKASGAMSSSTPSGERRTSPTRRFFEGVPLLHGRKSSRDGLSSFKPVVRASPEEKSNALADENEIPIQIIGPMADGADLSRASSVASQLPARNAGPSRHVTPAPEADISGQVDSGLASPPTSAAGLTATSSLAPSTAAMLHRYSHILTSPTDAAMLAPTVPGLTPAIIANPPRTLIHSGPVLQVVTNNTVKDRYLFLFSDILVIAKPAAPPLPSSTSARPAQQQQDAGRSRRGDASELPTLKWTFSIKNIVELHAAKLSLQADSRRSPPRRHPLMQTFVRQFAESPEAALSHIMTQSGLPKQPSTIAQLLQQTPELDRERLTQYLCAGTPGRNDILSAFIEAQRLSGVSIESALRSLLLSLRFPRDPNTFETLLTAFAQQWTGANQASIKPTFTKELAINLVFAIMALNDALHGADPRSQAPGLFSDPLPTLSRSAFLAAFRTHDPDLVLSDRTLLRIYASVDSDPIAQALGRDEPGERLSLAVEPPGLPTKLAYGVASAPITVRIPRPDPEFTVRLYGQDLSFDPPILNFEESATQTFRVTSKSLGTKHAVFVRAGRTARYYVATSDEADASQSSDLPFSTAVTIERAFMQNRFTLTLGNAGGSSSAATAQTAGKRRYMFSVDDETTLRFWAKHLERGIELSASEMARLNAGVKRIAEVNADKAASALVQQAQVRLAAHSLALHVLKETLISDDTGVVAGTSNGGASSSNGVLQRSASSVVQRPPVMTLSRAPSDSRFAGRSLGAPPQSDVTRNPSISRHYYAGAGRGERELLPDPPASAASTHGRWPGAPVSPGVAPTSSSPGDRAKAIQGPIHGDALVLTCSQNSLLPLVLDALTKKV